MSNNEYIISIEESRYPASLRLIDNPPEKLYCIGNIDLLNKEMIAIIGTRTPKFAEDRVVVQKIVSNFKSNKDIKIISGLALGIDTIAHEESLELGTIAVLGSGLNVIYPSENCKLVDKIINSNGLIISELQPNNPPSPRHLIARNRIIAGMATTIIVVRAMHKSGTMSTVRNAIKYNKTIYCIKLHDENFANNDLIARGIATELSL